MEKYTICEDCHDMTKLNDRANLVDPRKMSDLTDFPSATRLSFSDQKLDEE